jgi:hypothetical protein
MRSLFTETLAIGLLSIGCVSIAYSQQASPVNVMPPPTQKSTISSTLTVVTPSSVSEPSPLQTTVTPQAPPVPVETKPSLPLPTAVETNTVPTAVTGQPAPQSAAQASPWTQTSTVQTSAWDKASTLAKPAPDLWSKPPANSRVWDTTIPVNSAGATTQWK